MGRVEAGTELTASYLGIEDGINREVRRNFLQTHFRYVKSNSKPTSGTSKATQTPLQVRQKQLKTHFRYVKSKYQMC